MLMIRFQRTGRTNDPSFRIVLTEKARAAKAGGVVARLGSYNPKTKAYALDEASVKEWIGKGAQPTGTVKNLLITKGVLTGKKVNVLPKKTVPKKEEAPAEAIAAPVVEVSPEASAPEVIAEVAPAEAAAAPTEEPAA